MSKAVVIDWQEVAAVTMHPAQRAILVYLAEGGEASPVQVTKDHGVDMSLSGIAYHFTVLLKHGLIEEVRSVPRRGAVEHFYALTALAKGERS